MTLGPQDFRINILVSARSGTYSVSQTNLSQQSEYVVTGDLARLGRFLEETREAVAKVAKRYEPPAEASKP